MKKLSLLSLVVTVFCFLTASPLIAQKNKAFQGGEELVFTVSYAFLDAARATMKVSPEIDNSFDHPSYKIDVYGQTLGVFKLFKVNDNWGTYLDTAKIIPHASYRHIEEGRYRKHEKVYFDHKKRNAHVKLFDRENVSVVDTKDYTIPPNVQDIVSGFYYLRTMDMKNYQPGDTIVITGFFDKEIYTLKLLYEKKESIKTKIGEFETFVLTPIIPKNKLFRGEQPVTVWVSNDANRIPLKIKAKLKVGAVDMEITEATGLLNN